MQSQKTHSSTNSHLHQRHLILRSLNIFPVLGLYQSLIVSIVVDPSVEPPHFVQSATGYNVVGVYDQYQ